MKPPPYLSPGYLHYSKRNPYLLVDSPNFPLSPGNHSFTFSMDLPVWTFNINVLMENPMDGGAWWAAIHGVARNQTRLSNFFTFHFHALEKEMATHSSVLAWRIPGTGEPVGCRLWGRTESDMTEAT